MDILFIHSSIDEYCCCFYIFAIVNNAAMNIGFLLTCEDCFQCLYVYTPVSYTHLTLPTKQAQCRSRWSPYH